MPVKVAIYYAIFFMKMVRRSSLLIRGRAGAS
jgi:hypothetical protein